MATRKLPGPSSATDGESPIFAAAKQIADAMTSAPSNVVKFEYEGKLLTAKVNANGFVPLRAAKLIPGKNIQGGELFALPPQEAISLVSDGYAYTTQEGTFSEEDVRGVRD